MSNSKHPVGGAGRAAMSESSEGREKILRYPTYIGDATHKVPCIIFNAKKMDYDNLKTTGGVGNSHILNMKDSIALSMVPGLSFSDNIAYDQRETGMAGSIYNKVKEYSDGKPVTGKGIAQDAGEFGSDMVRGMSTSANSATYLAGVIKLATGSTALAAGGLGLQGALDEHAKQTGAVLNRNPFQMFSGVGIRSWSFQWNFLPSSAEESVSVRKIVKRFRMAMYPEQQPGSPTLQFPEVFDITFLNASFPYMPSVILKDCAISYNKNSSSFFNDAEGSPVQIAMDLTFQEMVPIYRHDIARGF